MFPEFYCDGYTVGQEQSEYLHGIYDFLFHELGTILDKIMNESSGITVQEIMDGFMNKLPDLREITVTDIQAAYNGDPAANSYEEIICAYPGFYAIFVNRIAHI
jgi:serine O-acetyltransferase